MVPLWSSSTIFTLDWMAGVIAWPSDWKKLLLRAAGFGAGFAVALVAVLGVWLWLSSRPKPWNKNAIKAGFDRVTAEGPDQHLEFFYILENTTNNDYRVAEAALDEFEQYRRDKGRGGSISVAAVRAETHSLAGFESDSIKLDRPIFVPAKHKTQIKLTLLGYSSPRRMVRYAVNDPEFATLPLSEQKAVLAHFDPDFGKLSDQEFQKAVERIRTANAASTTNVQQSTAAPPQAQSESQEDLARLYEKQQTHDIFDQITEEDAAAGREPTVKPIPIPEGATIGQPSGRPYQVREDVATGELTALQRKQIYRAVAEYVSDELSNLDGFTIFDESHRYEISLPPGWRRVARDPFARFGGHSK